MEIELMELLHRRRSGNERELYSPVTHCNNHDKLLVDPSDGYYNYLLFNYAAQSM